MTSPTHAQNQVTEAARYALDKNYGLGTIWEAPDEEGREGFERAQAETRKTIGDYLDADHIRVLIETGIYRDRRINGPGPLTEPNQPFDDQQVTVPVEMLVYFADLASAHLAEKLDKLERAGVDEQTRLEAHRDVEQMLWAREILRPVL